MSGLHIAEIVVASVLGYALIGSVIGAVIYCVVIDDRMDSAVCGGIFWPIGLLVLFFAHIVRRTIRAIESRGRGVPSAKVVKS